MGALDNKESHVKHFLLAALAIAGAVTVAAAQTRAVPAAETIRMRQANYKQMGAAFRGLNEQLRSDAPNIADIRRHAATIRGHAGRVLTWFPHGTGAEAGVRTRAKPEIWSDPRGFRIRGANLLVAARGLDAAARRGDAAAVRTALPTLQRACAGCHETYRGPEN